MAVNVLTTKYKNLKFLKNTQNIKYSVKRSFGPFLNFSYLVINPFAADDEISRHMRVILPLWTKYSISLLLEEMRRSLRARWKED